MRAVLLDWVEPIPVAVPAVVVPDLPVPLVQPAASIAGPVASTLAAVLQVELAEPMPAVGLVAGLAAVQAGPTPAFAVPAAVA